MPDVQDREPNTWEAQLERRVELRLDPSSTIAIKRDVHNIAIDVEAGRFADAFHQVLRDPNWRFGLIRVERERRNRDKPFHVGERFQGRYELDEAIRKHFRGWGRTFFGDLVNIPAVKEWLCRIENQVAMQLDWDDTSLRKSFTESRNYASMSGKGEPYAKQECFSHVKHGIVCTRYGKIIEPGVR